MIALSAHVPHSLPLVPGRGQSPEIQQAPSPLAQLRAGTRCARFLRATFPTPWPPQKKWGGGGMLPEGGGGLPERSSALWSAVEGRPALRTPLSPSPLWGRGQGIGPQKPTLDRGR